MYPNSDEIRAHGPVGAIPPTGGVAAEEALPTVPHSMRQQTIAGEVERVASALDLLVRASRELLSAPDRDLERQAQVAVTALDTREQTGDIGSIDRERLDRARTLGGQRVVALTRDLIEALGLNAEPSM